MHINTTMKLLTSSRRPLRSNPARKQRVAVQKQWAVQRRAQAQKSCLRVNESLNTELRPLFARAHAINPPAMRNVRSERALKCEVGAIVKSMNVNVTCEKRSGSGSVWRTGVSGVGVAYRSARPIDSTFISGLFL